MGSHLRYLTVSKTERPVLRSYTVRAFRPKGPKLDVDFVLHGSAEDGTAGPAAAWSETCAKGEPVATLDEGIAYRVKSAIPKENIKFCGYGRATAKHPDGYRHPGRPAGVFLRSTKLLFVTTPDTNPRTRSARPVWTGNAPKVNDLSTVNAHHWPIQATATQHARFTLA